MSETNDVPTRGERLRARRPVAAPAESAATEGASEPAARVEANVVGVGADTGNRAKPGLTPLAHPGRTELRAIPTRRLHPLAVYLLERDVGVARGAELLGVSERRLRDVLAGRARFAWWKEHEIAADLGCERDWLFPRGADR